jgi:5-methyltetrahydrofolate--homocysteine methyltransferase
LEFQPKLHAGLDLDAAGVEAPRASGKEADMRSMLDRLAAGEILICDGAMGTLLQARGLQPGECPELWCVERPDDVRDVHRAYRAAGSDIAECNSFGGSRYKLRHYGLEGRATEINRAAAAVARDVAGTTQHVLGSVGPTGEFMEPYGSETEQAFVDAFVEQIAALRDGGADAVILETMTGVEEVAAAIRAARDVGDLAVLASFTFAPQAGGGYATMMGVTPEQAAERAVTAGADVVGANCGTGPGPMVEVIRRMRAAVSGVPILAMPNAGMPVLEEGRTVFRETPQQMADSARRLVEAGATIIGGCCGTTAAHIRAMREAVKKG